MNFKFATLEWAPRKLVKTMQQLVVSYKAGAAGRNIVYGAFPDGKDFLAWYR